MKDGTTMTSDGRPNNLDFNLVDDKGRARRLSDFGGSYPLVFFGFTHCKVVCPRALGRLSEVIERLGTRAAWLSPLYISVDSERDTPEVMRNFLQASYPRFTGLTGDKAVIEEARAAFRVFAGRRPDPDDPEGYEVPHSALTYLIGPGGELLTHFADTVDANKIVERLLAILPEGVPSC